MIKPQQSDIYIFLLVKENKKSKKKKSYEQYVVRVHLFYITNVLPHATATTPIHCFTPSIDPDFRCSAMFLISWVSRPEQEATAIH